MAVNEGNIHYVEFRGDTSQLTKEIDRLVSTLNQLKVATAKDATAIQNSTSNMASSMSNTFSSLNRALAGAGIVIGFQQIGSAIKSMLTASAELENVKTTFRVFTGSAEVASRTLAELKRISLESPLNFQDFVQGAKTLMGYGVSASQVTDVVKMLGDVSGGSADRFQRLSLAFGQVVGAGRLMGQEARQMINAGFNPLQFIAEKTGKSMADLQKEMKNGQISVQDVADAFKTATSEGGRFYGLSQEITNTLGGQWSKLQESLFFTLAQIGDKISQTFDLKGTVSSLSDFMGKLKDSVTIMLDSFKGNRYVAMFFKEFYTAVSNIILALPKLIALIAKLGEYLSMANPVFWMLLAGMKAFNMAIDKFSGKKIEMPTFVGAEQLSRADQLKKEIADLENAQKNNINTFSKFGLIESFSEQNKKLKSLKSELEGLNKGFQSTTKPTVVKDDSDKIRDAQLKELRTWEEGYDRQQKALEDARNKAYEFVKFTDNRLSEESMSAKEKEIYILQQHFKKVTAEYEKLGRDTTFLTEFYYKQIGQIEANYAEKNLKGLKDKVLKGMGEFQKGLNDSFNNFDLNTSIGRELYLKTSSDLQSFGTLLSGVKDTAWGFYQEVPTIIGEGFGEILSGMVTFDQGLRRIGNSLFGALGDFVKQLGMHLIKMGTEALAIQTALALITTPAGAALAIGIGTALVALGSVMKNSSSKNGQTVGGTANPSRVSAIPSSSRGQNSMKTGNTYTNGSAVFATQSIRLSIDLTGSITASPTGYNINKQYETLARVTGR